MRRTRVSLASAESAGRIGRHMLVRGSPEQPQPGLDLVRADTEVTVHAVRVADVIPAAPRPSTVWPYG